MYEKLGDVWLNHKVSIIRQLEKHANTFTQKDPLVRRFFKLFVEFADHTPSIQLEKLNATGGKNFLKLIDANQPVKYHLDRLGGRYGIGRVVNYYEDKDVYEIEIWDRISKKTKWKKLLRPVKIDDEHATELVQPERVLCQI